MLPAVPTAPESSEDVLPWGRTRAEYACFFDLADLASSTRLLDCGGGPSSFNAEMTHLGFDVISADPLYAQSKAAIAGRIEIARETVMAEVRTNPGRFDWSQHGSPEALEELRMSAMKLFLDDYEDGLRDHRCVDATLPDLPFRDEAFDLVLCSHLLFTWAGEALDARFLARAALEMARVGKEVRIFPLLDKQGQPTPLLAPLGRALEQRGHASEIVKVPYEFQKGANEMLRVVRFGL